MNERRSKIVAKIADNRSEVPFLKGLFDAGADVAWLNTAHQDEEGTLGVIERIRMVNTRMPIMIDTKGPEVRTKNVLEPIAVKAGDHITFTGDLTVTGQNVVHVTYPNFHNEIPVGESIFYDDASIETVVQEKTVQGIKCVVKSAGLIKNKKSLNIPNVHIQLPALSDKDKSFIHFCAKHGVDFIIHSFVRNKSDIAEIREILKEYPDYKGKIISKIENREGFNNTREILEHSDGLMVARGDLGAEVPLPELPFMQKKMVEAALEMGKHCIVATQVLESMIKNPRPTRAEVTDAANAVLDGTAAISMSGETAYGDYPYEATMMMGSIMKHTESVRDELVHFCATPRVSSPVFAAAKEIVGKAEAGKVKAIVVLSPTTDIVLALAAYRPNCLIVPVCTSESDVRLLSLAYAVRPVFAETLDVAHAIEQIEGTVVKEHDAFALVTAGKSADSFTTKITNLKDAR
jgi:pyruvate kinase